MKWQCSACSSVETPGHVCHVVNYLLKRDGLEYCHLEHAYGYGYVISLQGWSLACVVWTEVRGLKISLFCVWQKHVSINHMLFDLVLYAMLFTRVLIVGLLWSTVEQQVFENSWPALAELGSSGRYWKFKWAGVRRHSRECELSNWLTGLGVKDYFAR